MKRILLIGVGRWGINHLRVLKSMPIELFVADQDEERLTPLEIPSSRRSTDARSLFRAIDPCGDCDAGTDAFRNVP